MWLCRALRGYAFVGVCLFGNCVGFVGFDLRLGLLDCVAGFGMLFCFG